MQDSIKITHNQHDTQIECTCGWSAKALPADNIASWVVAHHDTHNVGVRILKDRLEGLEDVVRVENLNDKVGA